MSEDNNLRIANKKDDLELVRKWSSKDFYRHFAQAGRTGHLLARSLVADIIFHEALPATATKIDRWWMVTGSKDWLARPEGAFLAAFSTITPLREVGPNEMQSEVLITAFAEAVVTAGPDGITWIYADKDIKMPRHRILTCALLLIAVIANVCRANDGAPSQAAITKERALEIATEIFIEKSHYLEFNVKLDDSDDLDHTYWWIDFEGTGRYSGLGHHALIKVHRQTGKVKIFGGD